MTNLLGVALGRCLARQDGLVAAYLPDGAEIGLAEAMVRSANTFRPLADLHAYAIVVSSGDESHEDPNCQRFTPNNALSFRLQHRLAVVLGRHPDLESFVGSFNAKLNQGFPQHASDPVSLHQIAGEALDVVLERASVVPSISWDRTVAVERLAMCIWQLQLAYEDLDQGTLGWNACWLIHVAHGLEALSVSLATSSGSNSSLDIGDFFAGTTYASFALPVPDDGISLKKGVRSAGRAIAEALNSWWSDADRIEMSIAALDSRRTSGGGPFHGVDQLGCLWKDAGRP